jgi:hypothetical protein
MSLIHYLNTETKFMYQITKPLKRQQKKQQEVSLKKILAEVKQINLHVSSQFFMQSRIEM